MIDDQLGPNIIFIIWEICIFLKFIFRHLKLEIAMYVSGWIDVNEWMDVSR